VSHCVRFARGEIRRALSREDFAHLGITYHSQDMNLSEATVVRFRESLTPEQETAIRAIVLRDDEAPYRSVADSALSACQTYLALPGPTAAQITAQVRLLTRIVAALIRLYLRRYESVE
jgi:hypothetical protein